MPLPVIGRCGAYSVLLMLHPYKHRAKGGGINVLWTHIFFFFFSFLHENIIVLWGLIETSLLGTFDLYPTTCFCGEISRPGNLAEQVWWMLHRITLKLSDKRNGNIPAFSTECDCRLRQIFRPGDDILKYMYKLHYQKRVLRTSYTISFSMCMSSALERPHV